MTLETGKWLLVELCELRERREIVFGGGFFMSQTTLLETNNKNFPVRVEKKKKKDATSFKTCTKVLWGSSKLYI